MVSSEKPISSHLPEPSHELFSIYEEIADKHSTTKLSIDLVKPSLWMDGALRVGLLEKDVEIALLLSDNRCYYVDRHSTEDDLEASFPSIYHWAVTYVEETYPHLYPL